MRAIRSHRSTDVPSPFARAAREPLAPALASAARRVGHVCVASPGPHVPAAARVRPARADDRPRAADRAAGGRLGSRGVRQPLPRARRARRERRADAVRADRARRRPMRGRRLHARPRDLARRARARPHRAAALGLGRSHAPPRHARRRSLRLSVREPRHRGRRDAAPSARADLRVSRRAADPGADGCALRARTSRRTGAVRSRR